MKNHSHHRLLYKESPAGHVSPYVSFLLVVASAISTSPILGQLLDFPGNFASISAIWLILVLRFFQNGGRNTYISSTLVCAIVALLFFALMNSLYWGSFTFSLQVYFLSSLLVVPFIRTPTLEKTTEILTTLHLVLLIGAIIGFLYAFSGGEPVAMIENPDGRKNAFFLSTFSNTYFEGFIRPSGIYDEPGAFSFFICFTVSLRHLLNMSRGLSAWLLFLGFITGSLAHLVFVLFYVVQQGKTSRSSRHLALAGAVVVFSSLLLFIVPQFGSIFVYFSERLAFQDGQMSGDNRTELFLNAYELLEWKVGLWGIDGRCILNADDCNLEQYPQFGANPLSMLVSYGLFLSLPYYVVLLSLISLAVCKKDWVIFGFALLLLQRPNVMSFGYSTAIILVAYFCAKYTRTSYNSLSRVPMNHRP